MKTRAVLEGLFPSETGGSIDEAELVAKWIAAIEAPLSPGLCLNGPRDGTIHLKTSPAEVFLKVVDGEVDMVRIWFRVPGITIGMRIEAGENALATAEVMSARGDSPAWVVKHCSVVARRLINIGNRHNHAEESS